MSIYYRQTVPTAHKVLYISFVLNYICIMTSSTQAFLKKAVFVCIFKFELCNVGDSMTVIVWEVTAVGSSGLFFPYLSGSISYFAILLITVGDVKPIFFFFYLCICRSRFFQN